ncbi:hypothetical protein GE21DRAFT_1119390 [Neurospora crassa]|nr:hypothetical protein GE21DRAFT_1119390 [Neurospora crassa]
MLPSLPRPKQWAMAQSITKHGIFSRFAYQRSISPICSLPLYFLRICNANPGKEKGMNRKRNTTHVYTVDLSLSLSLYLSHPCDWKTSTQSRTDIQSPPPLIDSFSKQQHLDRLDPFLRRPSFFLSFFFFALPAFNLSFASPQKLVAHLRRAAAGSSSSRPSFSLLLLINTPTPSSRPPLTGIAAKDYSTLHYTIPHTLLHYF